MVYQRRYSTCINNYLYVSVMIQPNALIIRVLCDVLYQTRDDTLWYNNRN